MRTWNDWSDPEVNRKVAEVLGKKVVQLSMIFEGKVWVIEGWDGGIYKIPDYCNSWNDTGVLMVDNAIGTVTENGKLIGATTSSQQYYEPFGDVVYSHDNENPCRAVAIVFLMMNGGEENGE